MLGPETRQPQTIGSLNDFQFHSVAFQASGGFNLEVRKVTPVQRKLLESAVLAREVVIGPSQHTKTITPGENRETLPLTNGSDGDVSSQRVLAVNEQSDSNLPIESSRGDSEKSEAKDIISSTGSASTEVSKDLTPDESLLLELDSGLSSYVDEQARALRTLPEDEALVRAFNGKSGEFFMEISNVSLIVKLNRYKRELLSEENMQKRKKSREKVQLYRRLPFFLHEGRIPPIAAQQAQKNRFLRESDKFNDAI